MPSRAPLKAQHASARWTNMTANQGLLWAPSVPDTAGSGVDPRVEQLERLNDWLLSLSPVEFRLLALTVGLFVDTLAFLLLSLLPCGSAPVGPNSFPW
jgi:hypothetical protein